MKIDQIGVIFVFQVNNAIYEIKRAKQVFSHGKNEKHAFTAILLGSYKCKVLFVWNI